MRWELEELVGLVFNEPVESVLQVLVTRGPHDVDLYREGQWWRGARTAVNATGLLDVTPIEPTEWAVDVRTGDEVQFGVQLPDGRVGWTDVMSLQEEEA